MFVLHLGLVRLPSVSTEAGGGERQIELADS